MNVLDFAMKMEGDGKAYYENLAKTTDLPGLQSIFSWLAEDEQKHYEIFRALKAGNTSTTMPETEILDTARNVFALLPRGTKVISDVSGALDAYQHAMKLEADSCKLYEDAAAKEEDTATRNLLLRIAEEERKHFTVLENLYNFVNAPNQHLSWSEFSNVDEFRQFGRDVDD
jgi:rubrerythrin